MSGLPHEWSGDASAAVCMLVPAHCRSLPLLRISHTANKPQDILVFCVRISHISGHSFAACRTLTRGGRCLQWSAMELLRLVAVMGMLGLGRASAAGRTVLQTSPTPPPPPYDSGLFSSPPPPGADLSATRKPMDAEPTFALKQGLAMSKHRCTCFASMRSGLLRSAMPQSGAILRPPCVCSISRVVLLRCTGGRY